ncbi:MAG: VWA domain-containing protein [Lachnospiraceae bacterium]|nr:VWA domain-containing protein [Lachnospiraceae bacterium]
MITRPIIPMEISVIAGVLIFLLLLIAIWKRKDSIAYKLLASLRWLLILALIVAMLMRPMTKHYNVDMEMKNLDVLFVLDTTISMWADDAEGGDTRIELAKATCSYIMKELDGSNFALIRFDNRSQILAPFTMDTRNVTDALETIKAPDLDYAKGSSLNVPYDDMQALLESSSKKEGRTTIVFFLSDGEITQDDAPLRSFSELEHYIDGGAVLGFGTEKGSTMVVGNYKQMVTDPTTGDYAISKIDEKNLNQLAKDMDLTYERNNTTESASYLLSGIKSGSTVSIEQNEKAVDYEDVYFYFCYPLLFLLLWEAVIFITRRKL